MTFHQLDYLLFLKAPDPQAVMLGVLAHFGNQPPAEAALALLRRVEEISTDGLTLQKHFAQLRILAHLRNLQPFIDTLMDSLAKHIRMENDPWFKKGQEVAEKKKDEQFVESLLKNTDFDAAKIALLAGVTVEWVEELKQTLR